MCVRTGAAGGDATDLYTNPLLLPEWQGGGNGRRLLETLFDALRARGVTGLHLGLDTSNTHAVGFYEHLGFRLALPDADWLYGIDL